MGQNIFVTRSQSDKNRGQVITRTPKPMVKKTKAQTSSGFNNYGILIKNLVNELGKMGKKEIREFFGTYGDIEYIDMEINPITKMNKGYAIILYSRIQDAKAAIAKMNGFQLSKEVLMVSHVPSYMCIGRGQQGDDDGEGGNRIGSNAARMYMISKLARGDAMISQEIGKIN